MRFNGHLDKALVDTGSAFTILTKNYRHLVDNRSWCCPNFHAAKGSPIKVYGKVTVDVTIAHHTVPFRCYIADVVHNILGIDVLTTMDVTLELKERHLTILSHHKEFTTQRDRDMLTECQCNGDFFTKSYSNCINGIEQAATYLAQSPNHIEADDYTDAVVKPVLRTRNVGVNTANNNKQRY